MDTGKFVGLLVFGLVGMLVVVAFLPMIQETTSATDDFTNDGLWRMKEIKDGDVWTRSDNGWTYGDETITASGGSNLLLGDDWCIRAVGHLRSTATVNASTNLNNATVTAGEELIVASKTDSTWTRNLNYPGYGAVKDGDYVLTDFNESAYLNGDSEIYGSGVSEVDSVQIFVHVTASVDDGAIFTISQSTGSYAISDVTISNPVVNYTAVNGYNDLYKVTSVTCDVTFTATIDDVPTAKTGSISFSSYVVPYEVTAEKTIHPDSTLSTIINLLPLIAVIGLFMFLVGEFLYTRYL